MFNKTDKIIWEKFRKGEEDALSFIYHQNIDFLFFYGKKFSSDEELILDVIQDLFYYLIQKRKSLGNTENIRMYLLKSLRRRLFLEIKKRDKRQFLNQIPEPEIVFSAEEKLIYNEKQSEQEIELKRGMEKLNSNQREILYYRFSCDFDYKQICEIMNISSDSARQQVSRAIQCLKKYLNTSSFMILFVLLREKG